jgi:hypothetical protein
MIQKIILISSCILILINSNAQRNENSTNENPYSKIYNETHVGKRTARCIKYLLPPDVFEGSFYGSPCNDIMEKEDERIKQFEEFISFFIAMEKDTKQMLVLEKKLTSETFSKEYEIIDYRIGLAEKQGTLESDNITPIENLVCRVKGNLQVLKSIKAYVKGYKNLFPLSKNKAEDVLKYIDEGLEKFKDNKAIIAGIRKNLNSTLVNVYFPKPAIQNAEWEGWFKTYFAKKYIGFTYLKQALLSNDWYIKKNEISALPEYRQIGTAIAAKASDGKCFIIKLDIYQDYLGGKYTASRFTEFEKKEILCENLK